MTGVPEPLLNGRFTLYPTTGGGFHIAWIADGSTETQHLEIPAFVANTAKAFAAGKLNPASLMREMMTHAPTESGIQAGNVSDH